MNHKKLYQEPGEEALKQSLKRSFDENENIKLSRDEMERLEKAFGDKTFRNLMAEYVNEISDPKHRAEQDTYIRQLEKHNDIPDGKIILQPLPGFVLKFKYTKRVKGQSSNLKKNNSKKLKMFINIVHSDMVAKPTAEAVSVQNNSSQGKQWSLPYSFGPLRMEHDKDKNLAPTFDCCFHPRVLLYASKSTAFRDLVAQTARTGATQQYQKMDEKVDIDTSYYILKGTIYKNGHPLVMIQRVDNIPTVSKHDDRPDGSTEGGAFIDKKEHITSSVSSFGCNLKKKFNRLSKPPGQDICREKQKRFVKMNRGGGELPNGRYIPEYEIIERGEFDIADSTAIEGLKQTSRRPTYLVFRISLPGISSSSRVDLDISEERLELQSLPGVKRGYSLEVKLSYPVNHDNGTAKFDKTTSLLTVALPVHRPLVLSSTTSPTTIAPGVDNVEISNNRRQDMEKYANKAGDKSESPVWVEIPKLDQGLDLSGSPVLVENERSFDTREIDHSRWLSVDTVTHIKSAREIFASDEVLPTLNTVSKVNKEHNINNEIMAGECASTIHQTTPHKKGGTAVKHIEFEKNSEDDNLADISLTATDEKQRLKPFPPYLSETKVDIKVPSPFFKNNQMFLLD